MRLGIFIAIGLAITLPWFTTPGYLFFLDWSGIPSPHIGLDTTGGISGMPIQIAWAILAHIMSSAFAQKILILLMLVIAGISTFLLTQLLTKNTLASTIAGIFMMTNAFVFNRIQMGHIYLLYAYSLTPYAIYALLNFFKNPTLKKAFLASTVSSIVILLNIHHIILFPIVAAIILWSANLKPSISPKQYTALFAPFISVAAIILLISYINPLSSFYALKTQDLATFTPRAQCNESVLIDTIFLTANWKSPQSNFLSCSSKIFYTTNSALLALMLLGAWYNRKLFIGAIILVILTLTPLIPAMRDSAKYIADLALLESILLAYGVVIISTKIKHIPSIIICITLLAGYPMYLGLSHTIIPKNYPQSWYTENNYFSTLPNKPTTLFLPWHLYMPFDFTNTKTIGNPAKLFFTNATIIQSDNPELQPPKLATLESVQQKIINLITQYHPEYILLAHGSPEEQIYDQAISALPHFKEQYSGTGLTVWQFEE
jgi:hypothetical protein